MNERTFRAENALRLEDPERLVWLPPGEVVASLRLTRGMSVVDLGAGTGYFAIPIAEAVGPGGKVTAVDLQQGMLDFLGEKIRRRGGPGNIELALGDATSTGLAAGSADLFFLANVWHEIDDHRAALAEAKRVLRPGGLLAIVDWRSDIAPPPGPPADHRISSDDAEKTLRSIGWSVEGTKPTGRYHYLMLSRVGGPGAGSKA